MSVAGLKKQFHKATQVRSRGGGGGGGGGSCSREELDWGLFESVDLPAEHHFLWCRAVLQRCTKSVSQLLF